MFCPRSRALIGYLEVTWHLGLEIDCFPPKVSEWVPLQNLWNQWPLAHVYFQKFVHVEGFSSCPIFHPGKQVNYVSLQSQCLPRLIRVSQNNRYFFHVIKSKKGFIYDSRDIHCLKRTSCSTGVKFRKSSKSSSPGQTWIFKCDELN